MVQDFIFDGKALSDFGYVAVMENQEDTMPVSAMQFETIKSALSDISHRVAYNYESNYTSTLLIMKNPCEFYDEDSYLTNDDIAELTRWLARKQYKWFRYIDDDDDDEIWYQVQFVINKEFVGDKVIGLQLTINCNAPYGFTREFNTETTDNSIMVRPNTDEEGYIYPTMIITCSGGDAKITNTTTGEETIVKNCAADEVITFSGADLQQVSSSVTDHDLSEDFIMYRFPRFAILYGNNANELSFENISNVQISYRGIRKVGLDG